MWFSETMGLEKNNKTNLKVGVK